MVKIVYFVVGGESIRSGYYQKILRTLKEWEVLGLRTDLVIGTAHGSSLEKDWNDHQDLFPKGTRVYLWSGLMDRIIQEWNAVSRILRESPNAIYVRNTYYTPALAIAAFKIPVFVEINTVETTEFRGKQLVLRMMSNLLLFSLARQLFSVTHEIRNRLPFFVWRRKTTVISNGIDLRAIPRIERDASTGLNGVFLGAEDRPWHGVDKILRHAHLLPDITFHLCGGFKPPTSLPQNIIHHGFLTDDALARLLARMDFGIGSLALHRNSMNEACTLKVREYLAYGLPVLIGYKDTDIPIDAAYALNLGNCEENYAKGVSAIGEFARRWSGSRVDRTAISHIGIDRKERHRISVISSCINS